MNKNIFYLGLVLFSAPEIALANECVPTVNYSVSQTVVPILGTGRGRTTVSSRSEVCTTTMDVKSVDANRVLLMSLLKEQRAEIAELKKLITQQKEFQDRLENELLAKQDTERQLVAQQISNIPNLVARDADLVALLAQKIRELEVQSEGDDG